jgi:AcrR family transcriptional regulator
MTDQSVILDRRDDMARKNLARKNPARRRTAKRAESAKRVESAKRAESERERRSSAAAAPRNGRAARQAERREAILAAALEEFSASGFAATRLDDVARRAGVAKGTIYLYFRDKESLFQELVRSMLGPIAGTIATAQVADVPARVIAETIADIFVREIFGTRRKDVIRLIITEGTRFPKLAEFYYHEVIERVLPAVRGMLSRAVARGELSSDALARFPQLLVAPALMALVWNSMFDRFDPLDIRALMHAHLDLLFGDRTTHDQASQRTPS